MARSKGRKPPPPAPNKPEAKFRLTQLVDWASLAWSVLPSGYLTAVFYVFEGISASKITTIGLICLASISIIIKNFSARVAWWVILPVLLVASYMSYRQYNSYDMGFYDARIGFVPLGIDRTVARGAVVELLFKNNNDFDIYVKSKKRVSSVNGSTNTVNTNFPVKAVMSGAAYGIPGDVNLFPEPINYTLVESGTFDFKFCYGRTEESMDKGFTITGTFTTQISADGDVTLAIQEDARKVGTCDD